MIFGNELEQIMYQYWANRFGCKREDFLHVGTLIVREENFDETANILIYHIDHMSVVRIAASLAERAELPIGYHKDFGSLTLKGFQQLVGIAYQTTVEDNFLNCYLYPEDFKPFTAAENFTIRQLHPENDNAILLDFYAQCSEEDLDFADIIINEPDPVIYGLFAGTNIVGYASHRYWDDVIADIGVLVHPHYRSLGLGKAVVSELCQWCLEHDVVPMYRVSRENIPSWKIQEALGFTEMVTIEILKVRQ